jgi:hypothetical protein
MHHGFETRAGHGPSKKVMFLRIAVPLTLLIASDLPVAAQFGNPYPGQQGGQRGGLSLPGGMQLPGSRRRNGNQNQPTDQLSGKIQRISTAQLVLDPGDGRNIVISLDRNTRYISNSGGQGRYGDFDPGDEVSVDATRDNQNFYHAIRVSLIRKGTPTDVSDNRSAGSSSNDDPDKPVLKRAGSSPAPRQTSDEDPDKPRLTRGSTTTSDSAPTQRRIPQAQITTPDDDSSATVSRRPQTVGAAPRNQTASPASREADDPGPPVLRRGSVRVDNTAAAGSETAVSGRPSIRAGESNGVTRLPAPIIVDSSARDNSDLSDHASNVRATLSGAPSGDPVIQSAREAAANFSETLPNYVVKQFTTRYQTDTAKGNRTSWQALDVVTADVIAENGKETYKNIQVNGKTPRESPEKSGSWSTGEFVTIQLNLLAPYTDADFHNKRTTTIVNRAAWKYDFSVEQPRSNWDIHASAESYKPAYTGTIWIDRENNRVLRIEMSAKNMPKAFPLDAVESALDYDYVLIGDQKFLLPAHSETLSCIRGTAECSRNVIDFRNYRKFGADTTIKFETDK